MPGRTGLPKAATRGFDGPVIPTIEEVEGAIEASEMGAVRAPHQERWRASLGAGPSSAVSQMGCSAASPPPGVLCGSHSSACHSATSMAGRHPTLPPSTTARPGRLSTFASSLGNACSRVLRVRW